MFWFYLHLCVNPSVLFLDLLARHEFGGTLVNCRQSLLDFGRDLDLDLFVMLHSSAIGKFQLQSQLLNNIWFIRYLLRHSNQEDSQLTNSTGTVKGFSSANRTNLHLIFVARPQINKVQSINPDNKLASYNHFKIIHVFSDKYACLLSFQVRQRQRAILRSCAWSMRLDSGHS